MAPAAPVQKEGSAAAKLVTSLVSQLAIYSALLYYFGWVRTKTLLGFFGLSPDVIGLSAQDYMMRGIVPFVPVAIGIAALLLLATVVNRQVLTPGLAASGLRRNVVVGLCRATRLTCGTLLACAVVTILGNWLFTDLGHFLFGPEGDGRLHFWQPFVVLAGAGGLLYVDRVQQVTQPAGTRRSVSTLVRPVALYSLVLSAAFWAIGIYAVYDGQVAASRPTTLGAQPAVAVSSVDRILVEGATEQPLVLPGAKYKWRYAGLRLLIGTSDKYFLIPAVPREGAATVTVIDASDDAVRLEFLG